MGQNGSGDGGIETSVTLGGFPEAVEGNTEVETQPTVRVRLPWMSYEDMYAASPVDMGLQAEPEDKKPTYIYEGW